MAIELAASRPYGSLIGFAIHHAGFPQPTTGAANMAELVKRAASYDKSHSFRDYNGDGKNDAKFTLGELGYQWILYHVMIARDGSVLPTQDLRYVRFHATDNWRGATSLNLHGGGILLDGNFEFETPTQAQIKAAAKFIYDYEVKYNKENLLILGHKETAGPNNPTLCPGKNLNVALIRNEVARLHGAVPPTDNAIRVDELKVARGLLQKRLNTVVNPLRRSELTYLISVISQRIEDLQ